MRATERSKKPDIQLLLRVPSPPCARQAPNNTLLVRIFSTKVNAEHSSTMCALSGMGFIGHNSSSGRQGLFKRECPANKSAAAYAMVAFSTPQDEAQALLQCTKHGGFVCVTNNDMRRRVKLRVLSVSQEALSILEEYSGVEA